MAHGETTTPRYPDDAERGTVPPVLDAPPSEEGVGAPGAPTVRMKTFLPGLHIRRTHPWGRHRSNITEAAVVVGSLLLIQIVVFLGYWKGISSPSGDFLGPYNNEAFAWWRDGGLLHPPAWTPYIWGGFPAAAQVQNSGWYLPTGLVALITPYDISAAAVQQALHIALAGAGIYVLVRRVGCSRSAGLFGLFAYSFTTGFFSGAPYPDIVRGFALLPWLLLCLSPFWPWRRPWAVPLATLLLWQAAAGIYPGVLVAVAYTGAAWVLVWQLLRRPAIRSFVLPLAAAGVIAVALSAPKFLPQLAFQTIDRGVQQDLSVLNPTILATLVLPGFQGMPGVYSLNLLFVPAAVLVLLFFASWRAPIVRAASAMLVVGLFLAVPQNPLRPLVNLLPGVASSRFRLEDYLPVFTIAATLIAISGVERLQSWATRRPGRREQAIRGSLALLPFCAAAAMLLRGRFRTSDWVPAMLLLGITTLLALALAMAAGRFRAHPAAWASLTAGVLAVLAFLSGFAHADTVRSLWAVDTVAAQQSLWGATSGELIAHRAPTAGVQRPARIPLGPDVPETAFLSNRYNAGYYTGTASVGGYFVLHQSAAFVEAWKAMADPSTGPSAQAFWAAAGTLVPASSAGALPGVEDIQRCADTGKCGSGTVAPITYSPGRLTYQVSMSSQSTLIANEAYYAGWHVLLTDGTGRSRTSEPKLGPAGALSFDMPAGTWRVSLVYETPFERPALFVFSLGLVVLALWLSIGARRASATRRTAPS